MAELDQRITSHLNLKATEENSPRPKVNPERSDFPSLFPSLTTSASDPVYFCDCIPSHVVARGTGLVSFFPLGYSTRCRFFSLRSMPALFPYYSLFLLPDLKPNFSFLSSATLHTLKYFHYVPECLSLVSGR